MPGTLTPTCSFCGLRFASRPVLELHIREDHLQRDHHPEPDRGAAARARAPQPRADAPAFTHGQSSRPPRTTKEMITMAATTRRRLRAGWAMTALRSMIRAIRGLHAELRLASEAMFRPAGAPRPGSQAQVPASPPEHAGIGTERAQRAA
jgi:hypothetical protein